MTTIKHVALIGCGHIGSSILRALQHYSGKESISVVEPNQDYRQKLKTLAPQCHASIDQRIGSADLVILCTHLHSYKEVCQECAPYLKKGAIVSDIGSNKVYAKEIMEKHCPPHVHVIPGHPIAGNEGSGPDAGSSRMFYNRYVILTPSAHIPQPAITALKGFWETLGAMVDIMSAQHHDRVLAMTSHLPHLLAYALVSSACGLEESLKIEKLPSDLQIDTQEVLKYSAGGFRDATRIAASNPEMWCDVFIHNRQPVLEMLGRFIEELFEMQKAVRWKDKKMLKSIFNNTAQLRRGVLSMGQAGTFIPFEVEEGEKPIDESIDAK